MPRGVRSRNGCARCKAQRLKCDETWPACGRCNRLEIRCSGPVMRVRWSDKHEVLHPTERFRRRQSASPTQQTTVVLDPSPTSPRASPSYDAPSTMGPYLDTMPVLADDDNWINQTLEHVFFDGDYFLHAIPQPATVSDTGDALLELEETNRSVDAINAPELLEAQSPSHQAQAQEAASHPESCPIDPPPQQIRRPVNDYGSVFVEYYFKDAAPILSLYDSNMNPFRSTVSRFWDSSPLIYFTLQSMAAALLSNIYPQMSSVGARFRQQAIALFHTLDEAAVDEQALLALFMIGGTASWFNVNDTGAQYYILMREHVQRMTASAQLPLSVQSQQLFENFLTCWEMFLAFVVDDDKLRLARPARITAGPSNNSTSIFPAVHIPNPLTGVAGDAQAYLVRVGRLVRSNRRRVQAKVLLTRVTLLQLEEELAEAANLENALFSLEIPSEADIVHTGDVQTPTWHLTTLADVYRRVGLLQLYRVFPDVLISRMSSLSVGPAGNDPDPGVIPTTDANKWLRSFALRIISAIRTIPAESGTKDFQPFLLVATCSELRLPEATEPTDMSPLSELVASDPHLCLEATEVHQARGFLMSRLKALQYSLPGKPIQRCVEIVKATWEIMDRKRGDQRPDATYWLDVMMKNSWETFMA